MNPDVLIEVRFRTTNEGGRLTRIQGDFYGCPMFVNGAGFDCRLLLNGQTLELGVTYTVEAKFLCPEIALPALSVGTKITLWEGKDVADGRILGISNHMHKLQH
jgi:hypothetical protein